MIRSDRRLAALFLATAIAAMACRRPPADPGTILEARTLGLSYLEEDRLPEAEAQFRKLASLAPDDTVGHVGLARVYLRMGRHQDAEASIRRALKIDSADVDLELLLVRVFQITHRAAEARRQLERLARAKPVNPKVLYALADLTGDSAEPGGRRQDYLQRLVEVVPGSLPVRLELAQALAAAGDLDRAEGELDALRQLPPEMPPEARPFFNAALRALRAANRPEAERSLAQLHRYLEVTSAFQVGLDAVRGPEGEIAGRPRITPPAADLIRDRLSRDSTAPAVHFVDATARLPIGTPPAHAAALAIGDYDGDGTEDLYVSSRSGARLLHWDGGAWIDAAPAAGAAVDGAVTASFADYDNDGHLDLYVVDLRGKGYLFRNDGKGRFVDVTAAARVGDPGAVRRILFVDLDHDGDLDLFLVTEGGNRFFRNNGNGTFTDLTREVGLGGSVGGRDAAFGDFDGDGLIDLVVVGDSGVALFHNTTQRRFTRRGSESGVNIRTASATIAVGDYDNDGFLDWFIGGAGGDSKLLRGGPSGTFTEDPRSAPALKVLGTLVQKGATFFDYDNDGHLDLVVVGDPVAPGSRGAGVLRNDGTGRFTDHSIVLPSDMPAADVVVAADVDHDGDLDLVTAGSAGLRFLSNVGGNLNLSIRVELTGLRTGSGKNNNFGIGAKLELRARELYQTRVVTDRVTMFGLGRHLKSDVLRIEWPNGVPQVLFYPGSDQDVVENQVLKSSCAFVYGWDGTRYRFLTDAMWRSALGMPVGIGGGGGATYASPGASKEYVRIPGHVLVATAGRYRLQLTEELWETSYTDQFELLVIDHPDSTETLVNERFVAPGPPVILDLFRVSRRRPPLSAVDDRGTDLLPVLREADDHYAADLTPDRYQGVTEPHDLILDLGDRLDHGRVLLALRGWVFPTDASINVALSQSRALAVVFPYLEVKDAAGRWRTAIADVGFPSGKDKTVIVDLTGKFPTNDHRVRIRTNMQIYWDQASILTEAPNSPVRITRLKPTSADLHYRGFSRMYRRGGRYGPHWFAYDDVTTAAVWRPIDGMFTRFGDVLSLFRDADDQYVIMGPGDETTVEFDEAHVPPLAHGWTRDFLLYTIGWIKDADLNTAQGGTVEPLPFHAMTRYPYGREQAYPTDEAHRRYRSAYNTRPGAPPINIGSGGRTTSRR